jgi:hypothetical protein
MALSTPIIKLLETDNLQFEIINTIDGVEALTKELPIILCGSAS